VIGEVNPSLITSDLNLKMVSKADKEKELATIIAIVIVGFIILVIKLMLAWIQFARFMFWLEVIFFVLSIIIIPMSLINIFRKDESYFFSNNYFWKKEVDYILGVVGLAMLLLSIFSINYFYEQGYSDEAIKKKAELEKMLEEYTLIFDILTKKEVVDIELMVAEELYPVLCEASPEINCDTIIASYNTYQELIGYKETADSIAFWVDENKLN
jgi:amino acid transporter